MLSHCGKKQNRTSVECGTDQNIKDYYVEIYVRITQKKIEHMQKPQSPQSRGPIYYVNRGAVPVGGAKIYQGIWRGFPSDSAVWSLDARRILYFYSRGEQKLLALLLLFVSYSHQTKEPACFSKWLSPKKLRDPWLVAKKISTDLQFQDN